jgi:septum formation protein
LVLGCDQMLECDERWFDKANTPEEAAEQLNFLSGKTHRLITAATLLRDGRIVWQKTATAKLTMRELSSGFIATYIEQMGDRLLGSVGCYAVEGLGSHLFTKIEGSHFVILGLPLLSFLQALRSEGVLSS